MYRGSCQVRKWHSNCASPTSSNCRHSVALRAQSFCCSRVPIALYAECGILNLHNKISIIKEVGVKRMKINVFEKNMQIKLRRVPNKISVRQSKGQSKKQATCLASKWPKNKAKLDGNWTRRGARPWHRRRGGSCGAEIKAKCVAQR